MFRYGKCHDVHRQFLAVGNRLNLRVDHVIIRLCIAYNQLKDDECISACNLAQLFAHLLHLICVQAGCPHLAFAVDVDQLCEEARGAQVRFLKHL